MKGTRNLSMETDKFPKIPLPGDEKFRSYKTSLQEYCHKKKFAVPQYSAEKESDDGLVGTVSFSFSFIKCEEISGSMKEAGSRAAFEALKQLGYLSGQTFEMQHNLLKWKDGGDNMETNAKQGTTNLSMETAKLPKITLPDDEKFRSYKTSLQEYCHKKKFAAPQYFAEKESDGLIGTVSFSCSYIKCKEISGSMKEADSHAAFEALKQLGYLRGQKFEMQRNQLKRKDGGDNMETNAKQVKPGTIAPITSKSHLNQIAKKIQVAVPTYNTVTVAGGFFSTVTVDNKQFKSMSVCKKRKDAEEDAAQVALNAFGPISPTINASAVESSVNSVPPVRVKNLLQEYCQKASKALPQYDMKLNEADKTYQATVTVDGIQYFGCIQRGKKVAEMAAAEEALNALGLLV